MMLYEALETFKQFQHPDFFKDYAMSKRNLLTNLNRKIELREYQKEALGRFFYYLEDYPQRQKPTHLMFNMATGSGKTLIMAAAMLNLYEKGYRNFLFFTRLGNIVEKTRGNFLAGGSNKYLFAEDMQIANKSVKVREVSNFDTADPDAINILFATTSLLHSRLNEAREDSVTYEDLSEKPLVLIADEAHNLSAETNSANSSGDLEDRNNWEKTVLRLLKTNSSKENVLLEFTATARLEADYPEVVQKYQDKAIFKYDLKEFRQDRYSKDVKTIQIDAKILDRALCALVISQYRLKIAEKYKIRMKPVILFKANRVTAPRDAQFDNDNPQTVISSIFKSAFHDYLSGLSIDSLSALKQKGNPTLTKAFTFFDENEITLDNLLDELKRDFAPENCLTVDDDKDTVDKQRILNSLEDQDNHIRAIFATEKLNEGWDVLNLFDIVRLYNSRDAKNNKAGKTTVQEAQLIGRGARYYPFATDSNQEPDRRKFDADADNELRILEQLYYHSVTNPKYIQELESVLVKEGIVASRTVERQISIKETFKDSDFWKNGVIYLNERREVQTNSSEAGASSIVSFEYLDEENSYKLGTFASVERELFEAKLITSAQEAPEVREIALKDLGLNVLRHTLGKFKQADFLRLKDIYRDLTSIEEFITSDNYLGGTKVRVSALKSRLDALSQFDKVQIASFVIEKILNTAATQPKLFEGTKTFKAHLISQVFANDKILQLDGESQRAKEMQDFNFANTEWFGQNEIWGTSEEEAFVRFIEQAIDKLKAKYDSIVLLRNEQYFSLFNFQDGAAFYPDFLLLLRERGSSKEIIHQVFVEPKGDQFLDANNRFEQSKEGWKQSLMLGLSEDIEFDLKFENEQYRLVGLPFYNSGSENPELKSIFSEAFDESLL